MSGQGPLYFLNFEFLVFNFELLEADFVGSIIIRQNPSNVSGFLIKKNSYRNRFGDDE
jgi:hypothetical protein